MYLQINEKYRIAGDRNQWILQKLKVVKGIKEWRPDGYFPTLESAVNELAVRQLRTADATNVQEALEVLRVITKQLTQALSPNMTIVPMETK